MSGRDLDGEPTPLAGLFAHVAEHAHLYRTLLGDAGSARVINHLLRRITASAHQRRSSAADQVDDPHDPVAAFLAVAVLGAVIDWLRRDCPGTPEQMSAAIWPHLVAASSPRVG